jgi:hypothetical protein
MSKLTAYTGHCMHPMKCLQNTQAYFATAVSYMRKMFMKLTTALETKTSYVNGASL